MSNLPKLTGLAEDTEFLGQLRETRFKFANQVRKDYDLLKRYAENPAEVFLEFAPASLQNRFTERQIQKANAIMSGSDNMARLADAMHAMEYVTSRGINQKALLASGWGKTFCEIGIWTAIVLVIGGAIAISQGALIAPLIAVQAGIIPVLAAITGLSEAWISVAVAAGGFTFGKLISAACEKA